MGPEQTEDTRKGPCHEGRTTGQQEPLEMCATAEKDHSGSVAQAGRGQDGGREAREAPATAQPLPSSFFLS